MTYMFSEFGYIVPSQNINAMLQIDLYNRPVRIVSVRLTAISAAVEYGEKEFFHLISFNAPERLNGGGVITRE